MNGRKKQEIYTAALQRLIETYATKYKTKQIIIDFH
jgi:hypothetical protein